MITTLMLLHYPRNTCVCQVQSDTKKREFLKNPTKIEEIQEKNIY